MTKKIKVAVIGLGYWGPHLIRNFSKIKNVEVTYGCDLNNKILKEIKIDYPSIIMTEKFSDIINDKKIDLVAISTPPATHFYLAREALLHGKHVLVEKPFTRNSKDAKKLIKIADDRKRILMVGHTFIFSEAIKKIKNLIDKNGLGKLHYYDSTRINLGKIQQDTNVIWDLAVHDFSILSFLIKEKPISLLAIGNKYISKGQEEVAHIFINYKKNITAHIYISWLSPIKVRTILIGGDKKMIAYDDIEPSEKIRIYNKGVDIPKFKITPFAPAYRSGDILIPKISQKEALFSELSHLINCITTKSKPLTSGSQGLEVVKLLEATDRSLLKRGEVILNE